MCVSRSPPYGLRLPHTDHLDGHGAVGALWFAIFLQLFLIAGVIHTLATDSIAMHRFQISVFGAIAVVFAVGGIDSHIYSSRASEEAIAAGWFILCVVDILWTLYFTSEEDSLMLYVFNSLGTGGLTGPGRRRRRPTSVHNIAGNGYSGEYAAAGTMGPSGVAYDAKTNSFTAGGPVLGVGSGIGSGVVVGPGNGSFKATSMEARSMHAPSIGQTSPTRANASLTGSGLGAENIPMSSPMMGSGAAGLGAGGGPGAPLNPATPPRSTKIGRAHV